ncbi:MAG TPA: DUF3574 domain-containing protein [Bryobacteraceae bacterium]|nr:DUF3574 domain-containing protein [Bryobacteraceae bacterium]
MGNTRRSLLMSLVALGTLMPTTALAEPPKRPTAATEVWVRTELYFGTMKPDNQQVTEAEFAAFVEKEVTERFPDGLTLLTGYGQFRNSAGAIIREKSFVLILFYPPQQQDANKKVQEIRDSYKTSFQQESVLRVDSFSVVSF